MANDVTLVLADHHVLVAEGLGRLLDAEDDLVVLGVVHHTGQAIESAAEHRPAVLVLDADLPTSDLAETLAAAKAASPATRLLVLSGDAHPDTTAAALSSGADGFLGKDRSSRGPGVELRARTLTSREREFLSLLTIGWSNRRIAEANQLSYLTVRSHMQNLLLKLGVHSQLEAVAFAVEHGIVEARGAPPGQGPPPVKVR